MALNKKGNSRGSNITTATGMKDAQKMEESINPSAGKPWSFTREREGLHPASVDGISQRDFCTRSEPDWTKREEPTPA